MLVKFYTNPPGTDKATQVWLDPRLNTGYNNHVLDYVLDDPAKVAGLQSNACEQG